MTVHATGDVVATPDGVEATLTVSKGTYIRSLAVALGEAVGLPAHLGALRRLGSGALRLDDPRTVDRLDVTELPAGRGGKPRQRIRWSVADEDRDAQAAALTARVVPLMEACPWPRVELPDALFARLALGQRLDAADLGALPGPGPWAMAGPSGGLILAQSRDGVVAPLKTLLPAPEPPDEADVATGEG